ncbi:MAG: SIMPL domain-containing protein [Candidatus Limnocylindrales bacterium]
MSSSRSLALRTAVIATVATLAILVGIPALVGGLRPQPLVNAAATDEPHGITVHGTGRVTLKPDLATLSLGVTAQASSAATAQSNASKAMNSIVAAVKKLGVADADMVTQAVSLNPTYDYSAGSSPRLTGYTATQTLSVKVRDLAKIGELIDASVAAGANQVGGVSFTVDDPAAATEQARKAAVEDAKKRAQTLAQSAGVALGVPISIVETSAPAPTPITFDKAVDAAGAVAPTTVQVGTTEVVVDVEIIFAIG